MAKIAPQLAQFQKSEKFQRAFFLKCNYKIMQYDLGAQLSN